MGDTAGAVEALQRALEQDPTPERERWARHRLAELGAPPEE
jgi:hypothetical protein